MRRQKLELLIKALETELSKAKRRADETHSAALEITKAAAGSPSQSGDREHAVNQASIVGGAHAALATSISKIVQEKDKPYPLITRPYVFVTIELEGSKNVEFFLTETPITLSGFTMVSTNSPLGHAVLGRKVGERFLVEIGDTVKSGEILAIE